MDFKNKANQRKNYYIFVIVEGRKLRVPMTPAQRTKNRKESGKRPFSFPYPSKLETKRLSSSILKLKRHTVNISQIEEWAYFTSSNAHKDTSTLTQGPCTYEDTPNSKKTSKSWKDSRPISRKAKSDFPTREKQFKLQN